MRLKHVTVSAVAAMLSLAISSPSMAAVASPPATSGLPGRQDPRLQTMFHSDRVWNAVAAMPNGRIFVGFPQADRPGVQVEELDPKGKGTPYPDVTWNAGWKKNGVAHSFVLINSVRTGPNGDLWLVDAGAPGLGKAAVKGGARLFQIDTSTNHIDRIYDFSSVAGPRSFVDDVRFHGETAYLTDAGMPGLIVLNLSTGAARRVLDNQPSTTDRRLMFADGKMLRDSDGKPVKVQADQLEISPDGSILYFQPASGPMSRIETKFLDDPSLSSAALASHVVEFANTSTTGGTAIDAKGDLYVSDENHRRILVITPSGNVRTLITDPRLIWVDAMWISSDGYLWMPAAQLNRTAGLNDGKAAVDYPVFIYRIKIGVPPPADDHP